MAMVVEYESCRSRFLLNEALLKESNAVRFRCRKCGGSIMMRNPHAPPVIPVSAVSAKIAASPVAADISSKVRNPHAPPVIPVSAVSVKKAASHVAADISFVVRPEIEQPTPHEVPVSSPTVPRREDLVIFSPGKDVVPLKASTRRKPSPGRNILVAGLSILLLAGGVLYFGTTEAGQELLGKWFPSWGSAPQATAATRPAYDVRELKSTAHEKAFAGNLFVVGGTVVNVGKGASRGIQMRAALLGGDNQVLMENSSLAGNLIDEPTLRYMNRNPIEVYLKMEHREGGEHQNILPGKSLPFMVVFFDPPGKIGSFTVHAVDAD
jgi:Protein of unknown function (DUF3426)